jgi:hypothetical protein
MPVIKFVFNPSLSQRIFSTLWKQATIASTFKKRKTSLVNNHKPISNLNTFTKYSKLLNMSKNHVI